MANYGYDDLAVVFDNSAGTTVNISQSVLEINGIDIEAMLEETHAAGDSWREQLFTGLKTVGDITIKALYDDDSDTGANFMFNDPGNAGTSGGASRTLAITWGGTKVTTVETIIKNFRRLPSRGALTKCEVVLAPTGAVTEA